MAYQNIAAPDEVNVVRTVSTGAAFGEVPKIIRRAHGQSSSTF
jgi:hypothetical protein